MNYQIYMILEMLSWCHDQSNVLDHISQDLTHKLMTKSKLYFHAKADSPRLVSKHCTQEMFPKIEGNRSSPYLLQGSFTQRFSTVI